MRRQRGSASGAPQSTVIRLIALLRRYREDHRYQVKGCDLDPVRSVDTRCETCQATDRFLEDFARMPRDWWRALVLASAARKTGP